MVDANMRSFLLTEASVRKATELTILVNQSEVLNLALEFTLIMVGMSESLCIRSPGNFVLQVAISKEAQTSKAIVSSESDKSIAILLGKNQMEYVQSVLLRAYRDNCAPVNHIHIEGTFQDARFDLTFLFEKYQKPMTAEQAAAVILKQTSN